MVILWLMIINMGRSCDTSLEAGLFKRIILHFISIMLFSLQNLFIIPYVSTSLAEFIDFYAVTFSPKFLSAIAPLKFITLSTFFFFSSLSKFTNSSTFFSLQNFSISNSLLLSQKRTNFTRSKVGVQSHAKSPSKPKKHGARQNKRISVPSDSYTLANSPTTIAQETTKATGKTR